MESYVESEYGYTLNTPPRRREDPLEDFLFETRAGHCEFFATAMVMILRVRGVPARIVTGFLGGELNDIGNFEVVRKEDAHAWVEVLDQQRGWISFDPTPPALGGNETRTFEFVAKSIDSLRMLWDMYVITFDYERQRGVLRGAGGVLAWTVGLAGKTIAVAKEKAKLLALIGGLIVLAVVVATTRFGRKWWAKLHLRWPFKPFTFGGVGPPSAVRFYGDLLARLEKMGFHRAPGVTPAEYAQSLEGRLRGLSELTRVYYQVRFGGLELDRTEQVRAERLATAIRVAALSDADLTRVSPLQYDPR